MKPISGTYRVSAWALFLLGIAVTMTGVAPIQPISAFAAVTKENRTFTEVTAATDTGASTSNAVPAGGLIFYTTLEFVTVTDPRTGLPVPNVSITKLKFAVDPERITGRMVNALEFPAAGVQLASANPEVVGAPLSGTVAINPGETFILDQSVPFDWMPIFGLLVNNVSITPHDMGDGRIRVIVPYSVFEGGCAGEGFGTCITNPGVRFLNDDSDPFDSVVHFAEVIVNTNTKTIESMRSRVNTRISGFVPPGTTNGKLIAFFHPETEQDERCVNGGGSRTLGFTLGCAGPPVNPDTNTVQLGVDRNGDGIISNVLTLYDVDTAGVKYTKLKTSPAGFLLGAGGISLGAIGTVDVEEFQLSMAADLLVFKSKDQPAIPPFPCPAGMVGCVPFPGRDGIDYNGDGDFLDTVIRSVSASGLFSNPSLTPQLGPTISNRTSTTPELTRPGDLLGTDGRYIFYYLSEEESPATFLPPDSGGTVTCTDLNADCDNLDFVVHVFDTQTGAITNTMGALSVVVFGGILGTNQTGAGIVSFGTDERSQGPGGFSVFGTDFNGDGDTNDTQLRFFDANAGTLVTTNVTLIDLTSTFQGVRFGSLPSSDGQIIGYTAAMLNGGFIGNDTPIDIRFIRLPGEPVTPTSGADTTPPTITPSSSPGANAAGWNNADVTVSWTVADPESGIASSTGCATTTLMTETAGTTLTCSATNGAGLPNSASVTVKIDKTPPNAPTANVSPAPNAAGWNNSTPVTVSFTSNGDAGAVQSGVASCTASTSLTSETAGAVLSGTCTDVAGNTSAAALATVKIDRTPPTITITAPADGGTYTLNAAAPSSYSCTDELSKVATCSGPVPSGANFNTSTIGPNAFTVNASDVAGNPASITNSYNVIFNFSGFLAPLSSGSSVFKLGSSIPIKWQLTDANGAFIGTAAGTTSLKVDSVSCLGASDDTPPFDPGTSGSTGLRYDSTNNQYIFNWQTKGLTAGCYKILMNPGDGLTRTTTVQLKL